MKTTKARLRQIIKEELEDFNSPSMGGAATGVGSSYGSTGIIDTGEGSLGSMNVHAEAIASSFGKCGDEETVERISAVLEQMIKEVEIDEAVSMVTDMLYHLIDKDEHEENPLDETYKIKPERLRPIHSIVKDVFRGNSMSQGYSFLNNEDIYQLKKLVQLFSERNIRTVDELENELKPVSLDKDVHQDETLAENVEIGEEKCMEIVKALANINDEIEAPESYDQDGYLDYDTPYWISVVSNLGDDAVRMLQDLENSRHDAERASSIPQPSRGRKIRKESDKEPMRPRVDYGDTKSDKWDAPRTKGGRKHAKNVANKKRRDKDKEETRSQMSENRVVKVKVKNKK